MTCPKKKRAAGRAQRSYILRVKRTSQPCACLWFIAVIAATCRQMRPILHDGTIMRCHLSQSRVLLRAECCCGHHETRMQAPSARARCYDETGDCRTHSSTKSL